MIRINLIAAERRAPKHVATAWAVEQKMSVAGTVLLALTLLALGGRYWQLGQRESEMAQALEAARQEEVRLAEVLKQVAQFEGQRARLKERVTLIDELRRGQTAPVHMVDQVSRALPEMTWLTSLKQDGYAITIEGQSTTLAALSDFVSNLESTRFFARPIEIVESAVQGGGQNDAPDLIEFTIKGRFQMAGIEPPARPAPAGGNVG